MSWRDENPGDAHELNKEDTPMALSAQMKMTMAGRLRHLVRGPLGLACGFALSLWVQSRHPEHGIRCAVRALLSDLPQMQIEMEQRASQPSDADRNGAGSFAGDRTH